jgi:hypothetical protein
VLIFALVWCATCAPSEILQDNGGHMERTCEQLLSFFDADAADGGQGSGNAIVRGSQDQGIRAGAGSNGHQSSQADEGDIPGGRGSGGPQIRFGPPQIKEFHSGSTGNWEEDTFPPPTDDFLTLERYMSSGAVREGPGAGTAQMSADEALAWQLQDRLFLQVIIPNQPMPTSPIACFGLACRAYYSVTAN